MNDSDTNDQLPTKCYKCDTDRRQTKTSPTKCYHWCTYIVGQNWGRDVWCRRSEYQKLLSRCSCIESELSLHQLSTMETKGTVPKTEKGYDPTNANDGLRAFHLSEHMIADIYISQLMHWSLWALYASLGAARWHETVEVSWSLLSRPSLWQCLGQHISLDIQHPLLD